MNAAAPIVSVRVRVFELPSSLVVSLPSVERNRSVPIVASAVDLSEFVSGGSTHCAEVRSFLIRDKCSVDGNGVVQATSARPG